MSSLFTKIRRRLRVLFRGAALQRDIEDEMRFHIELEAEQLRRSGLSDTIYKCLMWNGHIGDLATGCLR